METEKAEEYIAMNPLKDILQKKLDMEYEEREFFFKKLKTNFEHKWFLEKKTERIIEGFKQFLTGDRSDYIVYIGESPYFMVQTRKSSVLMVYIDGLCVIIYKAKQVDIPLHYKIDRYNTIDLVEQSLNKYANAFKLSAQINTDGNIPQVALEDLTNWCKRWAAHNQKKLEESEGVSGSQDEFERKRLSIILEEDLIKRFKINLILYTDLCYWHIVYGKNNSAHIPDGVVDSKVKNCSFEIVVDLPEQRNQKNSKKKTIMCYQRKGFGDPFWILVPGAWKEIIVFFAMFVMFVVLMSCPKRPEDYRENDFMHEYVCKQKGSVTGYACFMIVILGIWTIIKRKKSNSEKRKLLQAKSENTKVPMDEGKKVK